MEKLELYPYQKEAVTWIKNRRVAILGLEMGLGKSAITIHAAINELSLRKILILCPAIARRTWVREINLWSRVPMPLNVRVMEKRSDRPNAGDEVLVCSFDYITHNYGNLADYKFDLLLIDEVHYLKSVESKRTKAVLGNCGIIRRSERTWCLSGTIMPNHSGEIWALLHVFGATPLSYESFVMKFCNFYVFNGQKRITGTKISSVPELKNLLNTVMLRYKAIDVLPDLPKVRINEMPVEADLDNLTPEIKEQFDELEKFLSLRVRDMNPLAQLNALETVASSISTLRRYCVMKKIKPVCELISEELENKAYEKIIIFCVHREAVIDVADKLRKFGAMTIYGETSAHQRQENIDFFQNDKNKKVLVCNIGTAGTNITLTAADQIVFLEQSFVPGDNAQAIGRAARIGQKNSVNVRVASLAGTVDEAVAAILTRKTKEIISLLG